MKKVYTVLAVTIAFCASVMIMGRERLGSDGDYRLLCIGDLLVAKGVETRALRFGTDYPYRKIENALASYDYVFANMETPVTDNGTEFIGKTFRFHATPYGASHLKKLNVDVVSVANNHLLDYGEEGMRNTMLFLKQWGVQYTGAGENLTEARRPAYIKTGASTMVFLAYNQQPPADFFAKDDRPGTAPYDLKMITDDVKKYKAHGCLVFVSLHWGIEHSHRIDPKQIRDAHAIVDAGADAIIGHHPHVPQGIEMYAGKPVIYSLGNAVCGYYNSTYTDNIFVSLDYEKGELSKIEILPVAGDNYKIEFQPYVKRDLQAVKSIEKIRQFSSQFGTVITVENGIGIIRI